MSRLFQIIAAAVLLLSTGCTRSHQAPEVFYKVWYNWPERYLPDFNTLGEPDLQGVKNSLDLRDICDTMNHFVVLLETAFPVARAEEYTFRLSSDDGTRFYVDGQLYIDNDGAHGPILKTVTVPLSKGKHALRVEFFDFDKGQSLNFSYLTPTLAERPFNDKVLEEEDRLTDNNAFVKPQVEEAFGRFAAWKGEDDVLVFPILTDIHTAGRFTWKHIGYAAEAGKAFKADFMALLGDIGLNCYPASEDSLYAKEVIHHTVEGMQAYDGMWLYSPGNHDWDGGQGKHLSEAFLHATFQEPWAEKAGGHIHFAEGKTYGYYDVPSKPFRVIFLNSEGSETLGGTYYCYDPAQLSWLDSLLAQTPGERSVVLLSHLMPHPLGVWASNKPSEFRIANNAALMGLVARHAAAKGNIVGLFAGDAHVNFHRVEQGVNYYVSQGYGWVSPDLMLPGQTHAYFDYEQLLCLDVVAVKPSTREVHTFRIGAGGEDFDTRFGY